MPFDQEKAMRGKRRFWGIDQHGNVYANLQHPRKELQERLHGKAYKMYFGKPDGSTSHIGYVIRDMWIRLFVPFDQPEGKNL